MTEFVVSSVVARLGELLTQEANLFSGVEGQVKRLQEELRRIEGFSKYLDSRKIEYEFQKIIIAAYAAEDVVEIYALKSASKRKGSAINVLKQLAGIYTDHKFGSDIETTTAGISNLTQILRTDDMRVITHKMSYFDLSENQMIKKFLKQKKKQFEQKEKQREEIRRTRYAGSSPSRPPLGWDEPEFDGAEFLKDDKNWELFQKIFDKAEFPKDKAKFPKDEKNWEQLQKIVRSGRDCADFNVDTRMEALGKEMVYHCHGCPFTIKVLGGILATKYSLDEWVLVHYKILESSYRRRAKCHSEEFPHILNFSYENLPTWLKSCFLYFGQFPKGYEINVNKLIRLWIAEGFVPLVSNTGEEEMLEDVAEGYLNELVQRSMVLVGERDENLRIKTCHLHDQMRDLCFSKAHESYHHVADYQYRDDVALSSSSSTTRRLAVHMYGYGCQFPLGSIASPNLKSLLCFYDFSPERWRLRKLVFDNLKLLRVLDLEGADIGEGTLLKDIGELIYLRFLSLRHASVSKIPSSIGNLRCLQTLDLLIEGTIVHVPDVIWKMERLRHLYLPEFCESKTKLHLYNLINLRTLVNFPAQNCDVRDLFSMTNLRELAIRDPISIKNFTKISKSLSTRLKYLQALSLDSSEQENDKEATKFKDLRSLSFGDFIEVVDGCQE